MARSVVLLAALVLLALAAGAAGATKPAPTDPCVPKSLRTRAISFRTADGVRLAGLLLGSGKKGIVLSHEIRGWLCNWLPFAQTRRISSATCSLRSVSCCDGEPRRSWSAALRQAVQRR